MTVTNKEFQEMLKRFPGDLPIGIAINHLEMVSVYYDVTVEGIQSGDLKVVTVNCRDVDEEYDRLYNGESLDG